MSFGWGVGDLVQAATIAWSIYESFGWGSKSAKSEFAYFQAEFGLVKVALEKLQNVSAAAPEDDLELGSSYEHTIARCTEFIRRHQSLACDASKLMNGRRPSFHTKVLTVWDQVSWPLEREEAERLRRLLERYTQIAILKVTANTRDVTKQLVRESEQARLDHLELLKAIKTMSVQVTSILRRCLLDGSTDDPALDVQYLAGLQRRHLPSLLDPWPGLGSIPENDVLYPPSSEGSQSSQEALDRIQEITEKLGHLVMRQDTNGGHVTASDRAHPVKRSQKSSHIGTGTAIVDPVLGLLNHISDNVREALDKVGYEHVSVPTRPLSVVCDDTTKPTKVLNNAAEEWEQFHEWLQFQLVHSFRIHPGDATLVPPTWHRSSPEPTYSPTQASSPPTDCPQITVSPTEIPIMCDTGTPLTPSLSSESYYLGSRSPSSIGSDRTSSVQPLSLTNQPVQVIFPDPRHQNRQIHRPVACQVTVYFNQRSSEPEWIEGVNLESGIRVTHLVDREHLSKTVESTMIPYVPHTGYSTSFGSRLCIRFVGSHRVKIEENGSVKRAHISPIYICQDKQDFDMFQSVILRREVLFCGDVKRIHSSTVGDHCSLETVRVLRDRLTGETYILYFASNRGSNALAGFLEWPVGGFEVPRKSGKRDVKLQRARDALQRRDSVESTGTSFSHDSYTSGASRSGTVRKVKSLQFDFQQEKECDAFIQSLLHRHP
ncbi:hypothetical protein ARAM_000990 [Aspergillus rambellii]|uniref:Uncharacterized protein n=1 Tax=Aspergillus rambellii TaxID=308745 RepID=A0A0F8TX32_9EURO|nr:hypothetical protein ARAM_000990 [Aspergillus rambellii]